MQNIFKKLIRYFKKFFLNLPIILNYMWKYPYFFIFITEIYFRLRIFYWIRFRLLLIFLNNQAESYTALTFNIFQHGHINECHLHLAKQIRLISGISTNSNKINQLFYLINSWWHKNEFQLLLGNCFLNYDKSETGYMK